MSYPQERRKEAAMMQPVISLWIILVTHVILTQISHCSSRDADNERAVKETAVYHDSQKVWIKQSRHGVRETPQEQCQHQMISKLSPTALDVCGMNFTRPSSECDLVSDGCKSVKKNCSHVVGPQNETIIDCSCSDFTEIPYHFIPENTTHLILAHSCIETLNEDSFSNVSGLVTLDLSANYYLMHIHENTFTGLFQLKNLTMTCLRNKTARESSYPYLPYDLPIGIFSPLERLESLDLFGWTGFTRKHLNNVRDVLNNLNTTSLNNLTLEFVNGIYPDGVLWTIAPSFFRGPAMGNLSHLDLANNMIVSIRPKVLCALRRLEHLDISYNVITGGDFDLLMTNLSYMTELTHLNFSFQNFIFFHWNPYFRQSSMTLDDTATSSENSVNLCDVVLPPKLETLDISHRNMILRPYMFCRPRVLGGNSLKYLNMTHSWLDTSPFGDDWNFPSLLELNLATSREVYSSYSQFKNMRNVTHLNVARSYLDYFLPSDDKKYHYLLNNIDMPYLSHLDMTENSLVTIHQDLFAHFPSLRSINLRLNKLPKIMFFINKTRNLRYLDLSHNMIDDIPVITRHDWEKLRNFTVNMTGITIECSCGTKELCEWILDAAQAYRITIVGLSCFNRFSHGEKIHFFSYISKAQFTNCCCIGVTISFSIYAGFLLLTSLVTSAILYKWYLAYLWYSLMARFSRIPRQEITEEIAFDAFVCYSMRDTDWVVYHLSRYLEEKEPYRLCINERDFIVGKPVLENIMDSFVKSRKVILVISPNSLREEYLDFELHMACGEFLSKVICVLLVPPEALPRGRLPAGLEYLLSTQSYLIWPNQLERRNTFWLRIMTRLGKPLNERNLVMVGET